MWKLCLKDLRQCFTLRCTLLDSSKRPVALLSSFMRNTFHFLCSEIKLFRSPRTRIWNLKINVFKRYSAFKVKAFFYIKTFLVSSHTNIWIPDLWQELKTIYKQIYTAFIELKQCCKEKLTLLLLSGSTSNWITKLN